ncbi:2-C-methyl-D-erythritol 2,4-cyclodiphosphate synthase [candidate division FCPU426 bacterium]|nr:2-C-methyl-D-erythritol 2,4-cyclodiphosphate synthase [candidate division FCPU426 bacterium]
MRIGLGYDIHSTRPGNKMRLGGVSFSRAGFELKGHSDADVICHAVCDALLGAANLGDIGRHFPDTSARHRRRNSLEFLAEVKKRLRRAGARIVNVDCMLLAEAPKIAKQVPLMQKRMARALGISPESISIKATTQEGLGAIGRQEGLAALAVALVDCLRGKDAGGASAA